ncbi:hypothetical protein GARC_4223 [Paraglaciecola arctica BSs20135]|uniref:Uncharacterized protein n=1 Tax=Paraglaciecola arctica BSs20135 TaxID=493475 RepID=K6ZCK9_9ALTE|nr:hypothetical protein GARC_4223 [Paraglaciecola arctica BSs20135]
MHYQIPAATLLMVAFFRCNYGREICYVFFLFENITFTGWKSS